MIDVMNIETMSFTIQITAVLVAIIIIAVTVLLIRAFSNNKYVSKGALLTPAEKNFMYALQRFASKNKLGVAIKVRAADIVEPRKTFSKKLWWKRFRFLSQKHIDYVLINKEYLPVLAIELNDRSHLEKHRVKRDKQLESVFHNTSVPLLFITAKRKYDQGELSQKILTRMV